MVCFFAVQDSGSILRIPIKATSKLNLNAESVSPFKLTHFVLKGKTLSDAAITAIYDHSGKEDHEVVAFNPAIRGSGISVGCSANRTGCCYEGDGTDFIIDGINYVGDENGKKYLCYDGHQAYDYRTKDQDPNGQIDVFAAAGGIAHVPSTSEWGTVWIDHGSGYSTWYIHLSEREPIDGKQIAPGIKIGKSGRTSPPNINIGPHLHFEVRNNASTVGKIDPYEMKLWDLGFVDTIQPSISSGLTVQAVSSSQLNLLWSSSTDNVAVAGYKIYDFYGTYLKSVSTTSTSITGLNPNTQYCFSVSAYDVAGNESMHSSQQCATTLGQQNQNPVISSVIPNPSTVSPNGTSTITCNASDPDNDPLTYSWTATGGTVPGTTSTVIWTAPSTAGIYTVICTVSDNKSSPVSKDVNITVTVSTTPLSVTTTSLSTGTAGVSYPATNLYASGGKTPYTWSIASGSLPIGLSLSASGLISGTPTAAGTSNFTVRVIDSSSPQQSASKALTIVINPTATYSISGRVTLSGSGLSGVTMTLTGASSTTTPTDGNGNYAFSGAANGNYTLSPSLSGYTFTPTSKNIAVTNANVSGQDFTATATTGGILSVSPSDGLVSSGPQGGPFSPSSKTYTLLNTGATSINWTASKGQSWVYISATSGSLSPGGNITIAVSINSNANSLTQGSYSDTVNFTNTTNASGNQSRSVSLTVTGMPTNPPTVTTGTYQVIGSSSAQLIGTVNPNGLATSGWFQWGTTTSYGNTTANESLGSGTSVVQMLHTISGLSSNTTYHFRAVAQNGVGTSYGNDMSFTMPPPAVNPPSITTDAATSITSSSATLNGTVNPNGAPTTAWFEWGTTTSYGTTSPNFSGGSGTSPVTMNWAIGSLSPNTTYHFRAIAQNSAGTSYGSDRTFTTASAPQTCSEIEPNDTSLQANSLTLNVGCTGKISSSTDKDWFDVYVSSGTTISFTLMVPTGLDYDMALYGPDSSNPSQHWLKESINPAGQNETINYTASATGYFAVQIYGYQGASSTTSTYTITRTQ